MQGGEALGRETIPLTPALRPCFGQSPVLGQEFPAWQVSTCEDDGDSVMLICLVFSPL